MPPCFHRFLVCKILIMRRLLCCLPPTVSTLTGFVLRNAEEHPIPVKPLCVEVRNLTSAKSKPTSCQTHEPCLEILWLRE